MARLCRHLTTIALTFASPPSRCTTRVPPSPVSLPDPQSPDPFNSPPKVLSVAGAPAIQSPWNSHPVPPSPSSTSPPQPPPKGLHPEPRDRYGFKKATRDVSVRRGIIVECRVRGISRALTQEMGRDDEAVRAVDGQSPFAFRQGRTRSSTPSQGHPRPTGAERVVLPTHRRAKTSSREPGYIGSLSARHSRAISAERTRISSNRTCTATFRTTSDSARSMDEPRSGSRELPGGTSGAQCGPAPCR